MMLITTLSFVPLMAGDCHGPNCGLQGLMFWLTQPAPKPLVDWQALVSSGSDLYRKEEVSQECASAIEQCAQSTLLDGRCKSTYGSFLRSFTLADVNVDCNVDAEDTLAPYGKCRFSFGACDVGDDFISASSLIDTNKDGHLCTEEWVEYQVSRGFTREFGRWEWEAGTSGLRDAQGCVTRDAHRSARRYSLADWRNGHVERLVAYCQTPEAQGNRDCLGLPVICRDLLPSLAACQGFTRDNLRTRSLKDALDIQQAFTDPNQDGISSADEVTANILNVYDRGQDGCCDAEDWLVRYRDVYGFSEEFSRGSFPGGADRNSDGCVDRQDVELWFAGNLNGTQSTYFPDLFLFVITSMCEANPEWYNTVSDCAQVTDTLLRYYPEKSYSSAYVEQCGAKKYQSCVKLLPLRGQCTKSVERAEVHLEGLRIENQLTQGCVNHREACRLRDQRQAHVMRVLGMH